MASELELQHNSEIADARLGVAEELAWAVAALAGASVYLKWDNWLIAIGVAIASYIVVVYRYRKNAANAEDEYYRAARLGKYYKRANIDAA